jgi:hypothetical protein
MTWTAKKNRDLVRLLREYDQAKLGGLANHIEARRPARKRKFAFDDAVVGHLESLCHYYETDKGISRNATIKRIAKRLYNEIGGNKTGPSVESITWRLNHKLKKREAARRSAPPEVRRAESDAARRFWRSHAHDLEPISVEEYEDLVFQTLKDKLVWDVEKA